MEHNVAEKTKKVIEKMALHFGQSLKNKDD